MTNGLLPMRAADLIERALETLRARLLPHVESEADREAALLAFRALAIARAELESDPAMAAREMVEIEALLGRSFDGDAVAARRALAAAIRTGQVPADGPGDVRLRDHLLKAAANRLRITNPKYMTRRKRRAESSY